jgi:hypothetical protein
MIELKQLDRDENSPNYTIDVGTFVSLYIIIICHKLSRIYTVNIGK